MIDLILKVFIIVFGSAYTLLGFLSKTVEKAKKIPFTKHGWLAIICLVITTALGVTKTYRDESTIDRQDEIIINQKITIQNLEQKIQNYELSFQSQEETIQSFQETAIQNQVEMIENLQTLVRIQGRQPVSMNPVRGTWRLISEKGSVSSFGRDIIRKAQESLANEYIYWEFGTNSNLSRYKMVNGERQEFEEEKKFGGPYKFKNGTLYINGERVEHYFEKNRNNLIITYFGSKNTLERVQNK